MGGAIAFKSMWRRPDIFGHCAALSPCFQAQTLADVALQASEFFGKEYHDRCIYIDNGGDTDDVKVSPIPINLPDAVNQGWWWLDTSLQPGIDAMCAVLDLHKVAYKYEKFPGARHNEAAWSNRLELPLLYMFGFNGGFNENNEEEQEIQQKGRNERERKGSEEFTLSSPSPSSSVFESAS